MAKKKRLTDNQQDIIKKQGFFVVKACPGSGKTFAVAARLAKLLNEWKYRHQGIATISFTNVAWQEIEKYLTDDFGVRTPISYPHFLGTIDSFLNQYIFLPFGHLAMGCDRRPELIGPPVNNWEPIRHGYWWKEHECNKWCRLNQFSYDSDGKLINIIYPKIFENCGLKHSRCEHLKKEITEQGYATQRDANYFAMKVVQKYPAVAKAIAYRFPVMMMDEAQDTSDVEMRVAELLIENGLKEVMLIGDPEQAIFEWRDAKPYLLDQKYSQWKNNSLTLDENWRSSQKICDFFQKMSSLPRPPEAINGDVRNFAGSPEVWGYANQNYEEIIGKFLRHCENWDVKSDKHDIAVLVRSRELVKLMKGGRRTGANLPPWPNDTNDITEGVCCSKFLFDRNQFRGAFYLLEKEICKKARGQPYCSHKDLEELVSEQGFVEWRKQVYILLGGLPKTDCLLGEWIEKANTTLGATTLIKHGELAIKNRRNYGEMTFGSLFLHEDADCVHNCRIGTVHSVKGQTLDAILLILKGKAADARKYTKMLSERIIQNEELRIVYVAITRARKVLVVAVPESEKEGWVKKFFG